MIRRNPFTHSSKWLFVLSLLWTLVLLMIGAWWTYVMINAESILVTAERSKVLKMITWEGSSFIILLLLLSLSLLALFIKDQQKTKSLQAFFASLTHELKTPLASMRLQGEVISELLEEKKDPQLHRLLTRLIEDTNKLENQMDKILQLSRIERGGELNLTSVKLIPFIKKIALDYLGERELEIIASDNELVVDADEFALQMIFKNLLENSRIHADSSRITISINRHQNWVDLNYSDGGKFSGDEKKLGTLFYKHNSSKGSGIGLYLSEKLMQKMNGSMTTSLSHGHLSFHLKFKTTEAFHA